MIWLQESYHERQMQAKHGARQRCFADWYAPSSEIRCIEEEATILLMDVEHNVSYRSRFQLLIDRRSLLKKLRCTTAMYDVPHRLVSRSQLWSGASNGSRRSSLRLGI